MRYVVLKNGTRTDKCLACNKLWGTVFTSKKRQVELKHATRGLCRGCSRKGEYKQLETTIAEKDWKNNYIPKTLEPLLLPNEIDIQKLSRGSTTEIKHKCDVCLQEKFTPFKLFIQSKNLSHPKCKSLKTKQTNLKKYGVENHLTSPEYKRQTKQKMLENYGVENYQQLPEVRNRLNKWCEDNPGKLFTSKPEQQILDWTRTMFPSAKKIKKGGNEIDIFIPEKNIGIEFNGLWYHSENYKERTYHLDKTKYFEDEGIRVIHIWEQEWKKKRHQVESFLRSALGQNTIRLSPRNCRIVWSSDREEIEKAHRLLDCYHLQRFTNSTKYVANIYHEDTLIATATFGKHHRGLDQWVLSRFCTKMNYTVRGLLSKITKLAYSKLQKPLVSWADYRLSQGNGYEKSGWILEDTLPPDYFYYKTSTLEIVSKQSRMKSAVNTPKDMTEYEHARLDGLERVWDCGKIRFVYDPVD